MKTPHWYQAESVQALYDYFAHNAGHPCIALPGGTGKSFVMAYFIKSVFDQWPTQRVVMLTHIHTLITQNFNELIELWPIAPAGICSAGLNQYTTGLPIVFGGIQTVVNRVEQLGWRDLLIIDECHLLSPHEESGYQKVIKKLLEINPDMKVIGLSATCWRSGQGLLTDGGLFTDIVYDMTSYKNFNRLFEEGFLVPPIPKRTNTEYDLSEVHRDGYKYNEAELDAASNQKDLNIKVCREICERAQDRHSWLITCASIDHANKIGEILVRFGVDAEVVHSKKGQKINDSAIERWKLGKLRCIVTKDMCTTGVNNPRCDFLGCLRGMVSSSLWVQWLSRGTRPYSEGGKRNCLVLDFAANSSRLGPINDPKIPRKPGKGNPGTVPIRICEACGTYNHAGARVCIECGVIFGRSEKLIETPAEVALVRTDIPEIVPFEVKHVVYHSHQKDTHSPISLRVDYHVGDGKRRFSEWVCFEHKGLPKHKAHEWWRIRTPVPPPETTQSALEMAGSTLRVPRKLNVWVNRRYPEITGVEF